MSTSMVTRALGVGSYFLSGCLVINAAQFMGGPLYLINKDWYNAWIAFTKQSFGLLTMTMTQAWAPTVVRVSGDKSVHGQLLETADGNLLCNFPNRLIMMANHQIYTDWLYLWWIAYTGGKHGHIYIILKEAIKRIPVIGWGCQMSQFIFLKRNWEKDKPHLAQHLQKLNEPTKPMWLLLFPEGTNLAPSTRDKSREWAVKNGIKDMEHQLLPRSTGLQFCAQQLRKNVDYIYDCTIGYEGVPPGEYAQDIFSIQASYFHGKPPKSVNMYWRRFAISSIPVDDPQQFELWLRRRWREKDRLLDTFHRTGRFPPSTALDNSVKPGKGYITSQIKSFRWWEFLQIFSPIGLFALVLYTFYGALPRQFFKSISKQAQLHRIEAMNKARVQGPERGLLSGDLLQKIRALQKGHVNMPMQQLLKTPEAKNLLKAVQSQKLSLDVPFPNNAATKAIKAITQPTALKALTAGPTTSTGAVKTGTVSKAAVKSTPSTTVPRKVPTSAPLRKAPVTEVPKAPAKAPPVQKAPVHIPPIPKSQVQKVPAPRPLTQQALLNATNTSKASQAKSQSSWSTQSTATASTASTRASSVIAPTSVTSRPTTVRTQASLAKPPPSTISKSTIPSKTPSTSASQKSLPKRPTIAPKYPTPIKKPPSIPSSVSNSAPKPLQPKPTSTPIAHPTAKKLPVNMNKANPARKPVSAETAAAIARSTPGVNKKKVPVQKKAGKKFETTQGRKKLVGGKTA